jgi:hypothetical protein
VWSRPAQSRASSKESRNAATASSSPGTVKQSRSRVGRSMRPRTKRPPAPARANPLASRSPLTIAAKRRWRDVSTTARHRGDASTRQPRRGAHAGAKPDPSQIDQLIHTNETANVVFVTLTKHRFVHPGRAAGDQQGHSDEEGRSNECATATPPHRSPSLPSPNRDHLVRREPERALASICP